MISQELKYGADLITEYNRLQKSITRGLKILRDYSGMEEVEKVEELLEQHDGMEDFVDNVIVEDAKNDINIKNLVSNYYINKKKIQQLLDLEFEVVSND